MTLDEIVQKLMKRTSRVDRESDIRTSVRKAIRMVHGSAFYALDLVEEEVDLPVSLSKFKIPLPPRIRKFQVVAPLSSSGNPIQLTTPDNCYEYITPKDVIDSNYQRRSDWYYVAGASITINSSVAPSKLYLSFYAIPEVSDNNLETWIMRDYESIVIDAALSDFYSIIGKSELAREHRNSMLLQVQELINTYCWMEE